MPAKSDAQRMAAAIAEHHPEMLYKKNKEFLKTDKDKLHKFALTKGLKKKKKKF